MVERNREAVQREPPGPAMKTSPFRGACRRYARDVRRPLVNAGRLNASRIPQACGLELGFKVRVVRWFSLAKPRFTTGYLPCSLRERRVVR